MPAYDYKCKECGNVFEVFRRFSELGKEIKCPNCGSEETDIVFSVPHIQGETVAGSGYGKTEFHPINPEPSRGMGRGMGRCLGKGPRDGSSRGKGWRI